MSQEPIVLAIIKRRKLAGLSQDKMASVAGMSLKTYQRIERGENHLSQQISTTPRCTPCESIDPGEII